MFVCISTLIQFLCCKRPEKKCVIFAVRHLNILQRQSLRLVSRESNFIQAFFYSLLKFGGNQDLPHLCARWYCLFRDIYGKQAKKKEIKTDPVPVWHTVLLCAYGHSVKCIAFSLDIVFCFLFRVWHSWPSFNLTSFQYASWNGVELRQMKKIRKWKRRCANRIYPYSGDYTHCTLAHTERWKRNTGNHGVCECKYVLFCVCICKQFVLDYRKVFRKSCCKRKHTNAHKHTEANRLREREKEKRRKSHTHAVCL